MNIRPRKNHVKILISGMVIATGAAFAFPEGAGQDVGTPDKLSEIRIPENFEPRNLVAWCIVPFDAKQRSPAERAAMLKELGIGRLAYDWRPNPKPDFEGEILEMKKQGIEYFAFWGENDEAFRLFEKHGMHPQIWRTAVSPEGATQEEKIGNAVRQTEAIAKRAAGMGCAFGLYNHGGWGGEPGNLIAVCERLRGMGYKDVGIVYNWHHGHHRIDDWEADLKQLKPYLLCLNINGMNDGANPKIQSLSQGRHELSMLKTVLASGYDGPIGILDHRNEMDARESLQQNLMGLDWLLKEAKQQGSGGEKPAFAKVPADASSDAPKEVSVSKPVFEPSLTGAFGKALASAVQVSGKDAWREPPLTVECRARLKPDGAYQILLASDPKNSGSHWEIFSMVKTGTLTAYLPGATPDHIRSERVIADGKWHSIAMQYAPDRVRLWVDGKLEAEQVIRLNTGNRKAVPGRLGIGSQAGGEMAMRGAIDEVRIREGIHEDVGVVGDKPFIPGADGEIGRWDFEDFSGLTGAVPSPVYDRKPLEPELNPYWQAEINRERVYDFYAKQALHYGMMSPGEVPDVLPEFPGLDGGKQGHWGNQNDATTWREPRVGKMEYGSMVSGVFRGAGLEIPRAVTVKFEGGYNAVFDEEALKFRAAWRGEPVAWSDVRRGIMKGIPMGEGQVVSLENAPQAAPGAKYLGIHRQGEKVFFSYREGENVRYRTAEIRDGMVVETISETAPESGVARWPQRLETAGKMGEGKPYAIDTLTLPYENPWTALFYLSGVEILSENRFAVCTLHGDVWICDVSGEDLGILKWKRFAAGLNQPLGLKVGKDDGLLHVMCRDQLVALHDLNNDDEADFYECVSDVHKTSPGGHDFITGLQQDDQGRWYFASGNQGVCRLSADGEKLEVLGTGFRNPNGLAISPDGSVVLSNVQEGTWTPASAICDVSLGGHYGAGGPKEGERGNVPPMLYLPRGTDNSSGGQVFIDSDRWGPVKGQWVHLSSGTAKAFLMLREEVDGGSQGAAIPLDGEFLSGCHRGRFSPHDGQLYVASCQGWGSYGVADGALQRVRFTGEGDSGKAYPYPQRFEIRQNGILLCFADPQPESVSELGKWFAQQWNYQYGPAYGSPEFSVKSPGTPGHDRLAIRSVRRLENGRKVFLEIPQIQPVDQLHLHWMDRNAVNQRFELFATVHQLGQPFTEFSGYEPVTKDEVAMTPRVANGEKLDGAALMQACVACHHPTEMIIGPPFSEIRQKYAGNPKGIVKWAMNPQNTDPARPPMPSFDFLGEEKLRLIAEHILGVKSD